MFRLVVVLAMLTSCAAIYPKPQFGKYFVVYWYVDGPEAVKKACGGRNVNACMDDSGPFCLIVLDGNKPNWYKDHEKAHCFNVLTH